MSEWNRENWRAALRAVMEKATTGNASERSAYRNRCKAYPRDAIAEVHDIAIPERVRICFYEKDDYVSTIQLPIIDGETYAAGSGVAYGFDFSSPPTTPQGPFD